MVTKNIYWKNFLLPLLFYAFCFLIVTYPLVVNFSSGIYGFAHDNLSQLWDLWIKQKITAEDLNTKAIDYVSFPQGINYRDRLFVYTNELLSWGGVHLFKNVIVAYNFIFFLKFMFASYFMFVFLQTLGISFGVCLLSSLFFSANPFFLNMVKAYGYGFYPGFMSLTGYFLIRFLKTPTPPSFLLLILAFLLFFGENYSIGFYATFTLALAAIMGFGWFYFKNKTIANLQLRQFFTKQIDVKLMTYSLMLAIAAYSFYFLFLERIEPHYHTTQYPLKEFVIRAVHPIHYLIPTIDNRLLGRFFTNVHWKFRSSIEPFETNVMIGLIPIIMIISGVGLRRRLTTQLKNQLIFFVLMTVIALLLAVGPIIPLNLRHLTNLADYEQFAYIYNLSYISYKMAGCFPQVFRFHYCTVFFLTGSLALASATIFRSSRYRGLTGAALFFLVFVEQNNFSHKNVTNLLSDLPKAHHVLRGMPDGAVILWPHDQKRIRQLNDFFQIEHQRKQYSSQFAKSSAVDYLNPSEQKKMFDLGFRYLIIHKFLPLLKLYPHSENISGGSDNYFSEKKYLGFLELVSSFEDSILYKLNTPDEIKGVFAHKLSGFHFGTDLDTVFKWTAQSEVSYQVYSDQDYPQGLIELFGNSLITVNYQVIFNGEISNQITIKPGEIVRHSFKVQNLKKGSNTLVFRTSTPPVKISDVLGIPDGRAVGAFLSDLSLAGSAVQDEN